MLESLKKLGGSLHLNINKLELKFESNGKAIEVGKGKSFRLLMIEGIESAENELFINQSVMGDGSSIDNTRIKYRPIVVEIEYVGLNKEAERRKLINFFNIHKVGSLTLDYGGKKCKIRYTPQSFKSPIINIHNPLKFLVDLYCPNPFFKSPEITVEPLAAFVELFEFPSDYWEVGENGELYFEVGFEGEKREINIIGDAEVPIEIKIKGPIKNPVIKNNTTGDFIKVNTELFKDDVMIIDTEEATVFINGENSFHLIDVDSYFFKLQQGINIIEYTADTGIKEARLELIWQERYLGV